MSVGLSLFFNFLTSLDFLLGLLNRLIGEKSQLFQDGTTLPYVSITHHCILGLLELLLQSQILLLFLFFIMLLFQELFSLQMSKRLHWSLGNGQIGKALIRAVIVRGQFLESEEASQVSQRRKALLLFDDLNLWDLFLQTFFTIH